MAQTLPDAPSVVLVTRPAKRIAVVTLNRPNSLNAMDRRVGKQMKAAFTHLADDDEVSVVIVTGAGRGFSSGGDLSDTADSMLHYPPLVVMQETAAAVTPLVHMPQMTIAAVNGPAAGAGWGLAMACDLRIAGPGARFTATFIRMGLGPDFGLSHTLPRSIGRERALELLATGRTVDADEALRLGIVSSVVDDPLTAAIELASTIAASPTRAIRSLKRTLDLSSIADIDTAIEQIEARAQADLFQHPNFHTDAAAWINRHKSKATQPSRNI